MAPVPQFDHVPRTPAVVKPRCRREVSPHEVSAPDAPTAKVEAVHGGGKGARAPRPTPAASHAPPAACPQDVTRTTQCQTDRQRVSTHPTHALCAQVPPLARFPVHPSMSLASQFQPRLGGDGKGGGREPSRPGRPRWAHVLSPSSGVAEKAIPGRRACPDPSSPRLAWAPAQEPRSQSHHFWLPPGEGSAGCMRPP